MDVIHISRSTTVKGGDGRDGGKRGGCWLERGALEVHLGVDPVFRSAQKAHPGLVVEGLSALVETLEKAGFPVRPDEPLGGQRRVYVDDPFGNRIELIEAG